MTEKLVSSVVHLPYNKPPVVHIAETKLSNLKDKPEGSKGLFASADIEQDQPVVIYYGDKLTNDNILDIYLENKEEYRKIAPYLRGNGDWVINGFKGKGVKNANLYGVYVNDNWSLPPIKQEDLTSDIAINEYNKYKLRMEKSNLYNVTTADYPVYYAKRKIFKGEELYINYGIGYWLMYNGIEPDGLYDLKQQIDFT